MPDTVVDRLRPPRVSVRLTVPAPPRTTPPAPTVGLHRGVPIRRTRLRTPVAWLLLGAGAALSGVVAVVMLGAWSEELVTRATSTGREPTGLLTLGGNAHGLFLLTAAFLVLVASMTKVWALGAFLGGHRETASLLGGMLSLDLAVVAVSALGGGVGLPGCLVVVALDLAVIGVLGLPHRRRPQR